MTREEAIKHIQKYIKLLEITEPRAIPLMEALDMAIKALEQQPSDDTWSIKDVTNALTRHGLLEQGPSEKEKELNRLKAELQRAKMDAQTSYIQSPMPTLMIDKSNFNIEQYKSDLPSVTPTHGTCKDCKHNRPNSYARTMFSCERGNRFKLRDCENFYCADFEKRDNDKHKTYIDCQKCENYRNPDYSKCMECGKRGNENG